MAYGREPMRDDERLVVDEPQPEESLSAILARIDDLGAENDRDLYDFLGRQRVIEARALIVQAQRVQDEHTKRAAVASGLEGRIRAFLRDVASINLPDNAATDEAAF